MSVAGSTVAVGDEALGAAVAAAAMPEMLAGPSAEATAKARPWPLYLELVTHDFARRHLVLGVVETSADGSHVSTPLLLHAQVTPPVVLHNLAVRLGVRPGARLCDAEALARRIDEAYAASQPQGEASAAVAPGMLEQADIDELQRLLARSDRDLLSLDGKGPIVRLVDAVLFEALTRAASDVHIQPLSDRALVRYRLDGVLQTARVLPRAVAGALTSRIKVMAHLDIAETRAAQDGRATVTIGGSGATPTTPTPNTSTSRSIDLRIATLPTAFGERVVIRLLDTDNSRHLATLEDLGMPADVAKAYLDRSARSSGIVLVTGPTGSGKTTTLYGTLRWICSARAAQRPGRPAADVEVNVMTVEDPIEYDLSAPDASSEGTLPISQTQVNPKKGITFAAGLRHILRQDPDVIMVGEIRDEETARIAIQSSLTGHLVFSTLHTSDAPGAVTRLVDLGAEPYLVASSLSCVLAQRLVRRVHAACDGRGCEECLHAGLRGRMGVFELLVVDEAMRALIVARAPGDVVRAAAIAKGMRRLEDEGRRLAEAGVTTMDEVRRVLLGTD